jgi:hypothetical protein
MFFVEFASDVVGGVELLFGCVVELQHFGEEYFEFLLDFLYVGLHGPALGVDGVDEEAVDDF